MNNLILSLVIQTSHPLGVKETIDAILDRIASVPDFTPRKFGFSEPIKQTWDSASVEKLTPLYQPKGDICYFRFAPKTSGILVINTRRGNTAQLNEVRLAFDFEKIQSRLSEVERLFLDLALMANADFAAMTLGGGNPFSVDVANPANNVGEINGNEVPQANPTGIRFLNGIWWINFFGPAYVDFFGSAVLEGLPGHRNEFIKPGYFWLQPVGEPDKMWGRLGRETADEIKTKLNRPKAFYGYEKGRPAFMLPYETPAFDLTDLQTIPTP